MNVAFTSDLHLGHNQDFIFEARGFPDILAHDLHIKKTLREFFCDHMFILGDLTMGGKGDKPERIDRFLKSLPFPTTLVVGNHDPKLEVLLGLGISAVTEMVFPCEIAGAVTPVVLNHLPASFVDHRGRDFAKFTPADAGGVVFHGHTHSKNKVSRTANGTLQVCVGWDAWGKPVTIGEIDEWLTLNM